MVTDNVRAGETERQTFSALERTRGAEMATAAVAAAARAEVEARYVMALQRPRDLMRVREALLSDCRRASFAEVALYKKPVAGGHIIGPSIRFAEAFVRSYGNVLAPVAVVYDDDDRRTVRVSVTDLETNVTYPKDITFLKRVEKRKAPSGLRVFGSRLNSRGETVFIVEATEEEAAQKEAALISKALRTAALRLIPGDLMEDCMKVIRSTRAGEVTKDLAQARRKMVDAFASVGISAEQLSEYLGHAVDKTTAEEMVDLGDLINALRDKETSWSDAMQSRRDELAEAARAEPQAQEPQPSQQPQTKEPQPEPAPAEAKPKKPGSKTEALRARMQKQQQPLIVDVTKGRESEPDEEEE